jgi:hypothetical protein
VIEIQSDVVAPFVHRPAKHAHLLTQLAVGVRLVRTAPVPGETIELASGMSLAFNVGPSGTGSGSLNCAQATWRPRSAQDVSWARLKRNVNQYSVPGCNSGSRKGTVTSALSPGNVPKRLVSKIAAISEPLLALSRHLS